MHKANKPPATPTPQSPQLQPHPIASLPSVTLGVGVPSPAAHFQPRVGGAGAHAASYAPSPQLRQQPLELGRAALLFIDLQNYNCNPQGALGQHLQENHYYWDAIARATPLWQELAATARQAGFEVMYTVIQSLTRSGRDRGLDYQISGFHVPPASWDALVLDSIRPGEDEMVLPKSSSSVFASTTLHYLLRNMGISQLVVAGALTDQCVDHAIRDAADLGYWVTQVTDGCVTASEERHVASIQAVAGYCRQRTTGELIQEIRSLRQRRGP